MLLTYALIGLVLIFLLGSIRPINMGVLALTMAFVLGVVIQGQGVDTVFKGFPVGLFVILVGVTYLFGIAKHNGTVEWLVVLAMRAVRGKTVLIPWVMFVAAALLASIGAASPAAVAIIAPIGITFAVRYGLSPLMVGLMAVNGAAAGSFSPVGILGAITIKTAEHAGLQVNTGFLYATTFTFNVLIAFLTILVFRNHGRSAPHAITGDAPLETDEKAGRPTPERWVTLAGVLALVLGVVVMKYDAGLLAIAIAAILTLVFPKTGQLATNEIAWKVVLLVTGIVTYISVLQTLGVVDTLGGMVVAIGAPLLAAFLLCFIGALVSAFASTTGILGALVPLSIPFIQSGHIAPTALLSALAISSVVVDASPFSTNGALIVANVPAELQKKTYNALLLWGFAMIVVAPVLSWALIILVPWGL